MIKVGDLLFVSCIYIRPFEYGSYYIMALAPFFRPSIRPFGINFSLPDSSSYGLHMVELELGIW